MKSQTIGKGIYLIILVLILMLWNNSAHSQTGKVQISGVVSDSATKVPLEYLTIAVTPAGDTTAVFGLTKKNGAFSFSNLAPGKYVIKIQIQGVIQKLIPVNAAADTDLGTVFVGNSVKTIGAVTVISQRKLIKQQGDRITYDIQNDPESKGSSVLDMMRKVPFLSLDAEGNVLLKGSGSYMVLINGKPSALVVNNLKDIAQTMPASTIKSIQVITDPPSKYSAEGMAGIINIITISPVTNGYQGSVNVSEKGPAGGPAAGGTFSFKKGKFGMSSIAGAAINNVPQTTGTYNRVTSTGTTLSQQSLRSSDGRNAYGGLDLSYELDSLNLLAAQFSLNGNKVNTNINQRSVFFDKTTVFQQYALDNNGESKTNGLDVAVNYQRGFRNNKERLLTLSYRYMKTNGSLFGDVRVAPMVNFTQPSFTQLNDEKLAEHTVQLDYVHPLKSVTLEAGVKGIFRENNSDFQFRKFNSVSEMYELDPLRSNVFDNNQNVLAAYNSYTYSFKKWFVKAGVRAEQTTINGNFTNGTSSVKENYLNVVPSVTVSYDLDDNQTLTAGFSNRIQRPSIAQLNPFVDRINPDFESTGNPKLRPVTSTSIKLDYFRSKKGTLNITLNYLYFNAIIQRILSYDTMTKVTQSRFENQGKVRIKKINVFASYPLTKKMSFTFNSDLRHLTSYLVVSGKTVTTSGFLAFANTSLSYAFNKGWRVNGSFTFSSSGLNTIQSTINGYAATVFGVNKNFLKNKLSFSASVANPFSKFRHIIEDVNGPDFSQTTDNQIFFRSFATSLNYKFGKLKSKIKKNTKGIKNDDLVQ